MKHVNFPADYSDYADYSFSADLLHKYNFYWLVLFILSFSCPSSKFTQCKSYLPHLSII